MAQCLPSTPETLNLIPSTRKKKKKELHGHSRIKNLSFSVCGFNIRVDTEKRINECGNINRK